MLGSSKTIFNDGDVSWHIATGQWILDHRAIPHVDPFSFTWAGKPWVPIEWLAEVFYASAYRLAGYGGVAALVTAALMRSTRSSTSTPAARAAAARDRRDHPDGLRSGPDAACAAASARAGRSWPFGPG